MDPTVGPPHRDTFAVTPVVDYEPPTRNVPRCRLPSHAPPRPHTPRAARRAHRDHVGRHPATMTAQAMTPALSASMREAAIFADAALRRILEVIDRRRPATQLRRLLAPGLVDSVVSVSRTVAAQTGEPGGAAVLRRMRLQPVEGDARRGAAEVSGSYSRGHRMHAIACRVERGDATGAARWLVVALHVG
ncbi:hypothetical protein H7H78_07855 [Mycobacterium shinjukuense]|nr:Rv3235 family protein [Mycobacterium shinjukuense]MCV6985347.1 hypothetical protein [Mycobacterium shinjukuense]